MSCVNSQMKQTTLPAQSVLIHSQWRRAASLCQYGFLVLSRNAMLRRTRYYHDKLSSVCPSVRPSVTLKYCVNIGWNTSKIMSWLNSLAFSLSDDPTSQTYPKGNTPIFGRNKSGVYWKKSGSRRSQIRMSLKWLKIERKLLMGFRLPPKCVTLNEL